MAVNRKRIAQRLVWLASLWLERGHPITAAIFLENAARHLRAEASERRILTGARP
jgi:hypothetical protein